jgi:RimJ/RimL family protein N-acetyltransferase
MIAIRRAEPGDAAFLVELANHPDVAPFLGARRARDEAAILEQIERSLNEPQSFGRLVIEVDGERAGVLGFHLVSERNRIAHLEALAVHPDFRGNRVADEAARMFQRYLIRELGFHRLELECYAFNERAIAHAERAGYTREGVKRKAYERDGDWVDSVMFAVVAEDLSESAPGISE